MDKYKNVSPEQAAFLRKQRNDRLQIRTIQWMLFAVFLISWELASDLGCINLLFSAVLPSSEVVLSR